MVTIRDSVLQVRANAFGVGQSELGKCLFPVRGHLPFDEPALDVGCDWASFLLLLGALPGSFVLDITDGEPEQFNDRVIAREMAPVLDDLT